MVRADLVGRESEMASLGGWLQAAIDGHPGLVLMITSDARSGGSLTAAGVLSRGWCKSSRRSSVDMLSRCSSSDSSMARQLSGSP